MDKSNVEERYLWMAKQGTLNGVDYHIEGKIPFGYIFGVPCYDAGDYHDFEVNIKPNGVEKFMNTLRDILYG